MFGLEVELVWETLSSHHQQQGIAIATGVKLEKGKPAGLFWKIPTFQLNIHVQAPHAFTITHEDIGRQLFPQVTEFI